MSIFKDEKPKFNGNNSFNSISNNINGNIKLEMKNDKNIDMQNINIQNDNIVDNKLESNSNFNNMNNKKKDENSFLGIGILIVIAITVLLVIKLVDKINNINPGYNGMGNLGAIVYIFLIFFVVGIAILLIIIMCFKHYSKKDKLKLSKKGESIKNKKMFFKYTLIALISFIGLSLLMTFILSFIDSPKYFISSFGNIILSELLFLPVYILKFIIPSLIIAGIITVVNKNRKM